MAKKKTYDAEAEYRRYCAEIDMYNREFDDWLTRGKKIRQLYKDSDNKSGRRKRFNILWSNVQTLKPALYARTPIPEIKRRFKDPDPVGKWAAEVLERCIDYTVEEARFDDRMEAVVDDRLLGGRGSLWLRYKPYMAETDEFDPITNEPEEELAYECTKVDYVNAEDFGHNVARTWEEVEIVWRKVYMTRKKLVKRFGEEVGHKIPLDHEPRGLKDEQLGETLKKAAVYEIWDRGEGKVCFLVKGYKQIIEVNDDPLSLTGMFPMCKPLYATTTTDSLVPAPDYALYQTQAKDIEDLTARITILKKALKVAGVYDSSAPELANLLNSGFENKLLPVSEWAAFAEKGGIDGAIVFLPIKEVADVLLALYEARRQAKEDLYELTGLSDIIRGNSDPNETATAQQIKGRFAVLRISDSQADVQEFARDVYRVIGEIIAESYQLDTIKMISGVELLHEAEKVAAQKAQMAAEARAKMTGEPPENPIPERVQKLMNEPTWEEVYELLRHDTLRNFRIDIETDSTIRTDEEADRQERTEFLNVAGGFLQQAMVAVQQEPALSELMAEMLRFGIRGHRSARQLEGAFDEAVKKMQEPKPPQPNPEMEKLKQDAELKREDIASRERIEASKQAAAKDAKELDFALAQMEAELDATTEERKQAAQHAENLAAQQLEDERSERDAERQERIETLKANLTAQVNDRKAEADKEAKIAVAKIQAGIREMEIAANAGMKQQEMDYNKSVREEDQANDGAKTNERKETLSAVKEIVAELNKVSTD